MTRDRFQLLLRFFRVSPLEETNPLPPSSSSTTSFPSFPSSSLSNDALHSSSQSNLTSNCLFSSSSNFTTPRASSSSTTDPITPPRKLLTPLPHVSSLVKVLNENFGRYLSPGCQLAYDESMVDYQGFSTIRQYMKGKPHQWGYKILCLVYRQYLIAFEVYGGKRRETDPPPSPLGTTGDAVIRLIEKAKVVGFNHIVFLDSWFNSPLLVRKLTELGIQTCGAVKSQQTNLSKCPKVTIGSKELEDPNSPLSKVKMRSMQAGEYFQYFCGNITYLVVKDKTLLKLLYNHIPGSYTIGRSMSTNEVKNVPLALHHYSAYARGVDIINQLHYNYIIGRRSKACWPRLVWWLLELCILNAFYLWKKKIARRTHLDFRLLLIKEILDQDNYNIPSPSTTPTVHSHSTLEHQIVHSATKSRCVACWKNGRRKETNFKCISCNLFVCVTPCYDMHRTG